MAKYDAAIAALLPTGRSNVSIAEEVGCSEFTVRQARKRLGIEPSTATAISAARAAAPVGDSETHRPDGSSDYVLSGDRPWGYDDFREFIRSKGQDPDRVTFTWGVTTNPNGGYWNKLQNVKPKAGADEPEFTQEDIDALIREARMWKIPTLPATPSGEPVAAILNLADMQLFKRDGGGFHATMNRLRLALHRFRDHVAEVRARGVNLNELVLVNNGDPFEGVSGNYANQLHTVEGGLRAQMNAVLDVWLMFARELYPLFEKRQFVSVLSNHTQFGRQGGAKDSITGDEDNGDAFLTETLERILHATPGFEDVKFTIPHDEMNVYTTAAGIPIGFNHGHKIPKSDASGFEAWVNGQVRYDRRAYEARVWVTAHRHNLQLFDIGSATVLQAPSCDGGSKWLTDTTGKHSNSGVVSILVGKHHRLGWSDLTFL